MLRWFLLCLLFGMSNAQVVPQLQNPSFEITGPAAGKISGWQISTESTANSVLVKEDEGQGKEGTRALLIEAKEPAGVNVSQELFLPVGTTWKVSVWVKGEAGSRDREPSQTGALEIETPAGNQGSASTPPGTFSWKQEEVDFRVPSPGRVRVALLSDYPGKLWFDDVRLEPLAVRQDMDVSIRNSKISQRPIDLKQGGQFIEPLCHMIPSMLAQQVEGDSFEDETPCEPSYKRAVDWPQRTWYPEGAVHDATYSVDTTDPYNGKKSEKIELPVARARAGISQDGFYLKRGFGYRLHLHMKGVGQPRVWASLVGSGSMIAGPLLIGRAEDDWRSVEVVLHAKRSIANATLTIEFEGPGTLELDRIYFIGEDAVLGLWKPDVVQALKAMDPGIIRFGGSMIEAYEWQKSIGPWDERIPFVTGPWGGLEPNFVGIEEFVQLARYVGAEPLICVRWGGKKPQDAADEVEYMNGSVETHWGRIRARNGHPEPYQVKYWQIGNEVRGSEYDLSLRSFAEAMRKVDPGIKVLSAFPSADTLSEAGGALDYLCPHHYEVADLVTEKASFEFLRDQVTKHASGKDVRAAITEWNTTAGEMGLTRGMLLTLGNALSASRYQNLMHRYADLVEIAVRSNLSDSFGSGVIQPGPGWLYLTPTYYSQKLYQNAAGTYPLAIDRPSNIPWQMEEPDLSATLSPDAKVLRIFAVNSTSEAEKVQFHLDGFSTSVAGAEITVLKDRESVLDSEAMNSENDPERITTTSQVAHLKGSELSFSFAPFSVTMLELRLATAAKFSPLGAGVCRSALSHFGSAKVGMDCIP
jgi:alpha-N-arabinofuranosidase